MTPSKPASPRRKPASAGVAERSLRRQGPIWILAYDGVAFRLRDMTGLRYLAQLLGNPNQLIPAVELASGDAVLLPAERARLGVTQRIKAAIKRIAEHDPSFGHHLATCVRTGNRCVYRPDPANEIPWVIDESP